MLNKHLVINKGEHMLKKSYVCPLCEGTMNIVDKSDGVKILQCKLCKSEIHFGSWEAQRYIIDGEQCEFRFGSK